MQVSGATAGLQQGCKFPILSDRQEPPFRLGVWGTASTIVEPLGHPTTL